MSKGALPSQGDLDGRGQAGGEEVRWEVRVHGQQLVGLAGSQLDAVLHGGRQRHLGERVTGIDGGHLNTQDTTALPHFSCSRTTFCQEKAEIPGIHIVP